MDIGIRADDTDEVRSQKRAVVGLSLVGVGLIPAWATFYLVWDAAAAAVGPIACIVVCGAMLTWLAATKRLGWTPQVTLATVVVCPTLVHIGAGGFEASSLVFVWSAMAPLVAPVLVDRGRTMPWFGLFFTLFAVLVVVDPMLRGHAVELPHTLRFGLLIGNLFVTAALLTWLINRYIGERDQARATSEALLENTLPPSIVRRMKRDPGPIADRSDEMSVLFADLVGFTPLSASMAAEASVELLNAIYSRFDELVDKHGAVKLRTIGDGYMVAAGIPEPCPDHAERLAALGLDMVEVIDAWPEVGGRRLGVRVGINSGPGVAGVIGRSRLQYDVWGDTVNVASRMESHGVPGRVQITGSTRERIHEGFETESRGSIEVKGKGAMETWFVVRRRTADGDTGS